MRSYFFLLFLGLSFLWSLCLGFDGWTWPWNTTIDQAYWMLRFPRVLVAALSGAALSLAGLLIQRLLRNPLADPYILGVSSGASLGACLSVLLFPGFILHFGLWPGALLGSICSLGLLVLWSGRELAQASLRLIIIGVVLSYLFSALTSACVLLFVSAELKGMLFWMMGSFSMVSFQDVFMLLGVFLPTLLLVVFYGKEIDLLMLTDQEVASLGIQAQSVRLGLFFLAALLTAMTVSLVGSIGFVGLLIPHGVRLLGISYARSQALGCSLLGASVLMFVDGLSRFVLSPIELPIGLWTGLLGVPFFIVLLREFQEGHS